MPISLELYPDHAPTHLGLAIARGASDFAPVERALATLTRTKPIESAIVQAQLLTAKGDPEAAATTLSGALATAPAGFAGWTIPVEPFLNQLATSQSFTPVLRLLADRAA